LRKKKRLNADSWYLRHRHTLPALVANAYSGDLVIKFSLSIRGCQTWVPRYLLTYLGTPT